jgi:imidazoleglycerol phosphate synthase glutamine amidotransferase subunit HisH
VRRKSGSESNKISIQRWKFRKLKSVKDSGKKAVLDWMEQKICELDLKNITIPMMGLRHLRLVDATSRNYNGREFRFYYAKKISSYGKWNGERIA